MTTYLCVTAAVRGASGQGNRPADGEWFDRE